MAICPEYVFQMASRDSQDELEGFAVIMASSYQQVAWVILGVIQDYFWKRIYLEVNASQIVIDLSQPKTYACLACHISLFIS